MYGIRPERLFRDAATKYLRENMHKRSIADDASRIKSLIHFIGDMPLRNIHDGTLRPYILACKKKGLKNKTINNGIEIVRRILNLAARRWRDESGITWIETAPLLTMLDLNDARKPYPLSWDEQKLLLNHLPPHVQRMALFKVNTGTREQEVCQLQWDWQIDIPELGTSVFLVPGVIIKNADERLIILNKIATSSISNQVGKHPTRVFTFNGKPIKNILSTAWKRARQEAALDAARKYGEWTIEVADIGDKRTGYCTRITAHHDKWGRIKTKTAMDSLNEQRISKGLTPFRPGVRGWWLSTLRSKVRQLAIRRFLADYCQEYEALSRLRVHDLKHTFGRRLRAAGVPLETRKVLLGHRNSDITSHYSAPEIQELVDAANRVCESESGKIPALTILKRRKG